MARRPGTVLRVSRMTVFVPATVLMNWCVSVAMPDMRCMKLRAVRSAVSRERAGPLIVAMISPGKTAVPLADSADLILVYADEGGETQGFLVPSDAAGLEIGERNKLMGIKALPTFTITLTDCQIPAANKLGGSDGADFGLILAHSRVALGAMAVGMARAGYEYALDYAKQRVQFGEPIAHRQSIAFMLADMVTDVDEARLLVWEAAWKLDKGEDAMRDTAVMKRHIDEMVVRTADRAVQILGGYGYIREYPVELWLRNARGFATFDGLAIV